MFPNLSFAQNIDVSDTCPPGMSLQDCIRMGLGQVGDTSGYGPAGPIEATAISEKVGNIISYVLAFLGVIFLVITVASGIQWMTAGGNEEVVKKARTRLVNATVGLIIVVAAYAITWFVVTKLRQSIDIGAGSGSTSLSCSDPIDCEGTSWANECYSSGGSVNCIDNFCACTY